jgi:hypothetical protein
LKSLGSVDSSRPITLWLVLTPVIMADIVGALSGVMGSDERLRQRGVGNWSITSRPSTPTENTRVA